MSVRPNIDVNLQREPPAASGWRLTAEIHGGSDDGLTVIPRSGECSHRLCLVASTAAVRRSPSGSRAGFWQAYCADHARERGVESCRGWLEWAEGFARRYDGSMQSP